MIDLTENLFLKLKLKKKYNRKALWVVLPDLAVSDQNSLAAGFGYLAGQ